MTIYKDIYPQTMQKLLENPTVDELSFVQDYLYNESEPDKNHLKKYLDVCSKEGVNNEQHEALLLKYSSMTCDLQSISAVRLFNKLTKLKILSSLLKTQWNQKLLKDI